MKQIVAYSLSIRSFPHLTGYAISGRQQVWKERRGEASISTHRFLELKVMNPTLSTLQIE